MLATQLANKPHVPFAAVHVAHKARDHDLMHGEDHTGRTAGAPKHVCGFDHVRNAGAFTAEFLRCENAKQALRLRGGYCLGWKSGAAVDVSRGAGCDGGDFRNALSKITDACFGVASRFWICTKGSDGILV